MRRSQNTAQIDVSSLDILTEINSTVYPKLNLQLLNSTEKFQAKNVKVFMTLLLINSLGMFCLALAKMDRDKSRLRREIY